ncbi:MAG: hypothetical protein ACOZB3_11565 [Calditrichota bacterium]
MDPISNTSLPLVKQSPIAVKNSSMSERSDTGQIDRAAKQFEELLALQLVQTMEKSLEKGNMFGEGIAGDVYNGLTEWELARVLAKNTDFGIKENILRQIQNREDPSHEVHSR